MVLSPLLTSSFLLSLLLSLNLPVDFHVPSPEGEAKRQMWFGDDFSKKPPPKKHFLLGALRHSLDL